MAFFTDEQIAILSQGVVRLAFLSEFQFVSETKRVWNGHYPLTAGGQEWLPMHGTGSIDGIGMSSSITSEQVTFRVVGIPDQEASLLAVALEQTPEANQQLAKVYIQLFDDEWQPVGNPILIWFGWMQPPKVSRSADDMDNGQTQELVVTAENPFYNRSRPPHGRYTDRDQQMRYEGDKFFQFVSSLVNKTFVYPDY